VVADTMVAVSFARSPTYVEVAFANLACFYEVGVWGLPLDKDRADELFLRAAELGSATARFNIGNSYYGGKRGVAKDMKKATYHWELAAMRGSLEARYNLGIMDIEKGNATGDENLLRRAKDDYGKVLRAYQKSRSETKSELREAVAKLGESGRSRNRAKLISRRNQTKDLQELQQIDEHLARIKLQEEHRDADKRGG